MVDFKQEFEVCAQIDHVISMANQQYNQCLERAKEMEELGKEMKRRKGEMELVVVGNQLGTLALKAQQFDRAESLLQKALAKHTSTSLNFSHLHYNLGNLYMAKKDHLQALHHYTTALKASPFSQTSDFSVSQNESSTF